MASTIELIHKTRSLQESLKQLLADFSEDGLPMDERIFNRILTNDWRLPLGRNSPPNERYRRAVAWVNDFRNYVQRLREYCFHELGDRQQFENLPLNGNQRASADECLRKLPIQLRILQRWRNGEKTKRIQIKGNGDRKLRSQLKSFVDTLGSAAVADGIPCDRDTLEDFLRGNTKPQEKTLKKFQQYVLSKRAPVKK
jgi:hypothetical protein